MGRASVPTPAVYPAFFFVLEKAAKAQETQSYQRFQRIDHTDFNTSGTNGQRLLSRVKAGTHSPFGERSHTAACTPKQGAFRMGVVSLLSERSARSPTSPGRVSERQVLPLLGLGRGCSQRTQKAFGAAMRLCASLFRRRRGPAGLRDLFRFCRNCGLYALRSGPFRVCEARGGITTLSALYVLLKRRTAACQNGSFAVF